ncbi:Hypothetical protein PP7435_CHR2-1201 [Komagataella phaffii CBS 7435]|uniref:Uncharacterized protein n=2 Tax=Komagataella phaffii TaxID=460519 RepID=C4QZN7_KOMPG|nr:Hypothetical protein PAS_chr2-1_0108 [Komagataella phaffii GS115]AOA61943.1 GQ67_00134T0 [Komagataella phaffii]CAH2448792.1 Hypothetical protein BQ9382_C2-6445 [Komagataella phaffii CBS 7435]AOA67608.1 GQ68_01254T0 [Komagataella phaffii GS115]CAY68711.1 Hypothetical protein PAS_chr2-1_0108 [Komagataella phaffii GS115]CCA38876.1 Hypothetical protein PP7435_CHR2-1201 [Komagataella phaffii CBS 7435]
MDNYHRMIHIYSQLLDVEPQQDTAESYFRDFLTTPFLFTALNSTLNNIDVRAKAKPAHLEILKNLIQHALEILKEQLDTRTQENEVTDWPLVNNVLNILRVILKNVLTRKLSSNSSKKQLDNNQILVGIFGNVDVVESSARELIYFTDHFLSIVPNDKDSCHAVIYSTRESSLELLDSLLVGFHDTMVLDLLFEKDTFFVGLLSILQDAGHSDADDTFDSVVVMKVFRCLAILFSNKEVNHNIYKGLLNTHIISQNEKEINLIDKWLFQWFILATKCYEEFSPDLLFQEEKRTSLFHLMTFNRFNFNSNTNTHYSQLLTDQLIPKFWDRQLERYKDSCESNMENFNHSPLLPVPELLPVMVFFTALIAEDDFYCQLFATRRSDVDFLEVFLSFNSYVMTFQHYSPTHKLVTRMSLQILHKLLISCSSKLVPYTINQRKIKPSYQRRPLINPVGVFDLHEAKLDGEQLVSDPQFITNKCSIYYILDDVQRYSRYNLTQKLELDNYKLVNNIVLKSLQILSDNDLLNYSYKNSGAEGRYNWVDFWDTQFQVVQFISKLVSKHKMDVSNKQLGSIVEEILIIVEFVLNDWGKQQLFLGPHQLIEDTTSILLQLIYRILEHNSDLFYLIKTFELDISLLNYRNILDVFELFSREFKINFEEEASATTSETSFAEVISKIKVFINTQPKGDKQSKILQINKDLFKFETTFEYLDDPNFRNNGTTLALKELLKPKKMTQ